MSYFGSTEWYQRVQAGAVEGLAIVHKFGFADIGTVLAPVTASGFYRMPTAAVALEMVSDDANDTAAGTGARTVKVIGLDSAWAEIEQTVILDGTTPVALATDMIRVYRLWVETPGTYGGSHAGTITLREAGAGQTWAQMIVTPKAHGQSLIACYTSPKNTLARALRLSVGVDALKSVDLLVQVRQQADLVTPPLLAFRTVLYEVGLQGEFTITLVSPSPGFVGPADIVCLAKTSQGTAGITVNFELLLIDD